MTESLVGLLTRLSESGEPALLWGRVAKPHFGAQFDRFLASGVLVEQPPVETWSTCANCDCDFDCRLIREVDGKYLALCPIDAGADTVLEADDLRSFRIDAERLVRLIAEASGIPGPVEAVTTDLWVIGRLASERSVVFGFSAGALNQPATVLMLRAAAGGAPITVVAPDPGPAIRLRFLEAGIDVVELRLALLPTEGAMDRLDLGSLEQSGAGTQGEAELVVRKGSGAVEWRGTTIGFSHQQFPVLLRLVEGARSRSRIASGPAIEDTTGREAKDLIRELRQRVEAAGFSRAEAKSLFKAVRGRGYTLGVAPRRITVEE